MAFNNDNLTTFHTPWFDGAPKNADYATGVLTMASTPAAGETVTVGSVVYEAVASAGDIADPSYIPVVLAATPAADTFVVALAIAINANDTSLTALASTVTDTVTLTYDTVGTAGNAIATTETLTSGSFASATLTGGQFATPCRASSALIEISGTKYLTEKPVDEWTTDGWYTLTETET